MIEKFEKSELHKNLTWFCEPSKWSVKEGQLHIIPDEATDFWQRTHYGFQADNGHFLYTEVTSDFNIEARVQCDFKHQYDQAGLMVRVSDQCWIKTSVEFEPDEPNKLGAVVTNNGFSDWSTQDVDDDFTDYRLRISREDSTYTVTYFHSKSNEWVQIRMFHLLDEPKVKAGLYACSPKKGPFTAQFDYLIIE